MQPLIGVTASVALRGPAFGETYTLSRRYVDAVQAAGGVTVIVPHNLTKPELWGMFERLDGLLLSGGGDIDPELFHEARHPATDEIHTDRDRVELALARWVVEHDKPCLAICRGIQVLNVALGGSLIQDIPTEVPDALEHRFDYDRVARDYLAHPVKIEADSLLARVMQSDHAQTNSWHHQSIKQVGTNLRVTGYAPDGVIEAAEVPGKRFALAVQWHPEWMYDNYPEHKRLFEGLVQAAGGSPHVPRGAM
jgi:putative glutamine amidotransferase